VFGIYKKGVMCVRERKKEGEKVAGVKKLHRRSAIKKKDIWKMPEPNKYRHSPHVGDGVQEKKNERTGGDTPSVERERGVSWQGVKKGQ